jgi:hypothetical protein
MLIKYRDGSEKEHKYVRPPRFVLWRHQRVMQTFQSRVNEIAEGNSEAPSEEQGLLFLESLSDEEGRKYQAFTDDIVKHSLSPKPDIDELSEEAYWQTFAWAMYATPNTPVETKEGVTTVEAVETFSGESALSEASEEVQDVSPEPSGENGDS